MATTTLKEACFTYIVRTSNRCEPPWLFTVVRNQDGTLGVRNIIGPYGPLCNTGAQIPEEVLEAIQDSKNQVEDILSHTGQLSGTLTFTNQTSASITFSAPFTSTNYIVLVSLQEFVPWKISNKTTTGFDIELGVTFTGTVQYIVFV